jgi:hypothetical protein
MRPLRVVPTSVTSNAADDVPRSGTDDAVSANARARSMPMETTRSAEAGASSSSRLLPGRYSVTRKGRSPTSPT